MQKEFEIQIVGTPQKTNSGRRYIEGWTAEYVCVAFWDSLAEKIVASKAPFSVWCQCIIPTRPIPEVVGHDYWVMEDFEIETENQEIDEMSEMRDIPVQPTV